MNIEAIKSFFFGEREPGNGGLSVKSDLNCCCICSKAVAVQNKKFNL